MRVTERTAWRQSTPRVWYEGEWQRDWKSYGRMEKNSRLSESKEHGIRELITDLAGCFKRRTEKFFVFFAKRGH